MRVVCGGAWQQQVHKVVLPFLNGLQTWRCYYSLREIYQVFGRQQLEASDTL